MSKINNSNYNKVSVKTDSMVKMIEQLSKLGVFKEKRKPRKTTKVSADEVKQDSDMVGYVKTLEGQVGRGDPNLFALRQIQPGMSEQDIRDLRERNNAGVATLRAEIQQQRLEDIEAQQGQRFADITRLGGIMNPVLERFRGAQDPGAGQRVDPFEQTSTIFLPDVQEETFTETLNEGGPRAQPQVQTELFAEGEEAEARLGPQERLEIGGGGSQLGKELVDEGLKLISAKKPNTVKLRTYYLKLVDLLNIEEFIESKNPNDYKEEIKEILQSYSE